MPLYTIVFDIRMDVERLGDRALARRRLDVEVVALGVAGVEDADAWLKEASRIELRAHLRATDELRAAAIADRVRLRLFQEAVSRLLVTVSFGWPEQRS